MLTVRTPSAVRPWNTDAVTSVVADGTGGRDGKGDACGGGRVSGDRWSGWPNRDPATPMPADGRLLAVGGVVEGAGVVATDALAEAVAPAPTACCSGALNREAGGGASAIRSEAGDGVTATGVGDRVATGRGPAVIVTSCTPSVRPMSACTCFWGGIAASTAAS